MWLKLSNIIEAKKVSYIFINIFFFVTFNVLLIIKFIFELKSYPIYTYVLFYWFFILYDSEYSGEMYKI